MTLTARCMALRGVSKNVLAIQSTFFPAKRFLTRSSKEVLTPKRCPSTQSTIMPSDAGNNSTLVLKKKHEFISIYEMPYIRYLAMINAVKLQQTILCAAAVPVSSAMAFTGYLPEGSGWGVGIVGFMVCSTLYMLSFFCTNVIGFIYVSVDGSIVKIAYVDQWGKRKEDMFSSDDIIPVSELPRRFLDPLYYKVQRYSDSESDSDSPSFYKLHVTHARITDRDRFNNLFGKVDI